MLHSRLDVRPVVSGLTTPTTIAFLGIHEFFVLEKDTGMVKRVMDGEVRTVLDLAVNNFSERGLLGIALDPNFHRSQSDYAALLPA
jgi:glucose/arabinose dehydrogenase